MDIQVRHNGSAAGIEFAANFARIGREMQNKTAAFVREMIIAGCKIVTPDDGWVNRERHTVMPPSYANYNRQAAEGDLIALGTYEDYRIVRVIKVMPCGLSSTTYGFDPEPVAVGGTKRKAA